MALKYSLPITTEHNHLGDVINIIQCRLNDPYDFVGDYCCPCCGNRLSGLVPFLLSVIPGHKMRYCEGSRAELVWPIWMDGGVVPAYRKSDDLPETEHHVVCSFGARSKVWHLANSPDTKPPKLIEDQHVKRATERFSGRVIYNLSDEPLPGTVDMTRASIQEKFKLVASAYVSVSTDNGIAHLSLLTNAKTIIVHDSGWKASRFYSEGVEFWKTEDL